MDIFKIFVLHIVLQLVSYVHAVDLVSSLLSSARNMRCTSSPLAFNKSGFIQCQRACISYSRCDILRYNRLHLHCYLFANENCWDYVGDPDSNIYMTRDAIDESIGGSCSVPGCPASNICVMLNRVTKCLPDKVFAPYADSQATSVNVDGVYFWIHPAYKNSSAAKQICESSNGRLAILNTERKIQLVFAETKRHNAKSLPSTEITRSRSVTGYPFWFVDASLNDNGEWLWSNGETAFIPRQNQDGTCSMLCNGRLYDHNCNNQLSFVCEMM